MIRPEGNCSQRSTRPGQLVETKRGGGMLQDPWFTVTPIDPGTYAISEYGHWEEVHSYLVVGERSAARSIQGWVSPISGPLRRSLSGCPFR